MQVGDLVFWGGRIPDDCFDESLHGVVVDAAPEAAVPWCRVDWFEDNQEDNYRMDDIDIQVVKKINLFS